MGAALYAGLGFLSFIILIILIWLFFVQMKASKTEKKLKDVTQLVEFLDGENAVIAAWALRIQEELHPGST